MKNIIIASTFLISILMLTSCGENEPFVGSESAFIYSIHNGQAVPSAPYGGVHPNDFSASMTVEENEDGTADITLELNNTISGVTYHSHAHDAADPADTPNGTPYNEAPNADIFAQMIEGNGSTVSVTQTTTMSYSEITSSYSGFFVIHDPLQVVSTTDISSYLVVGSFARDGGMTNFTSQTFNYDFNTGQLVPDFAYAGSHPNSIGATIQVDELADDRSRVTVRLMNTLDGETYHMHAHDMADPSTTPNGTPYIESPNGAVYASMLQGNGGTAGAAVISDMSFNTLTSSYDGFFVVHDPLQAVSTVDPTTYVVLGVFARD